MLYDRNSQNFKFHNKLILLGFKNKYQHRYDKDDISVFLSYRYFVIVRKVNQKRTDTILECKYRTKFSKDLMFNTLNKIFDFENYKEINVEIVYQGFDSKNTDYDIFHIELGLTDIDALEKFNDQFYELLKIKNDIKISTSSKLILEYVRALYKRLEFIKFFNHKIFINNDTHKINKLIIKGT